MEVSRFCCAGVCRCACRQCRASPQASSRSYTWPRLPLRSRIHTLPTRHSGFPRLAGDMPTTIQSGGGGTQQRTADGATPPQTQEGTAPMNVSCGTKISKSPRTRRRPVTCRPTVANDSSSFCGNSGGTTTQPGVDGATPPQAQGGTAPMNVSYGTKISKSPRVLLRKAQKARGANGSSTCSNSAPPTACERKGGELESAARGNTSQYPV